MFLDLCIHAILFVCVCTVNLKGSDLCIASHENSHVEELGYLQFFCARIPYLSVVNDLCFL